MTAPSFFLKPTKMIINKKPNIMKKGFVKFYRDYENHRWFSDPNTVAVLVRCLLNANLSESYFEGQIIPKGSFATSIASLSAQTGVKQNAIRTALNRLTTDKVITIKPTNRFTIVSICGFDDCDVSETNNPQTTHKQPTNNPQTTVKTVSKQPIQQPTTEEEKEIEKEVEKEKKEEQEIKLGQQSFDFNINNNITSTIVDVPQSGGEGKEEEILDAEIVEEAPEKERGISEAEAPESVKEIPQKEERKKEKAEVKKEKEYSVTHRCRLSFEQQYLQFKGEEYYYAAKDANAVKQLIGKIKTKMPDDLKENGDEIVQNFTVFIQAIIYSGKVEEWVLDNFSLPVINSKFNEIYAQLKNGTTRQQQRRGPTDEFIRRTWEELQANGGLAF